MSNTPTPETDAFIDNLNDDFDVEFALLTTHARRLERDRNRLLALLHDATCEKVDAERERDEAREDFQWAKKARESLELRYLEAERDCRTALRKRDEAIASSNERGVVVSQVSGALVDAGCAVGSAFEFGELVRALAAQRDLSRAEHIRVSCAFMKKVKARKGKKK